MSEEKQKYGIAKPSEAVNVDLLVTLQPNTLQLIDCIDFMRECPSNYFDLAIVDPPYGIDMDGGTIGIEGDAKPQEYTKKDWDASPPKQEYFDELLRTSKNQIIWGANHFISRIPYDSSSWVIWDKNKVGEKFADGELAWTSFTTAVRIFKYTWHGFIQGDMKNKEVRIHPTQKPVALYKWLLKKYAKAGDLILDTHVGSGSSLVACKELGFDYVGYEIDKEYYEQAKRRLERAFRKYELEFE